MEDTINCYVIFSDEPGDFLTNPWRMLTHRGFRHVRVLNYCMKGEVADYFTMLDPGTGWLSVPLVLIDNEQEIRDYYPNSTIIRVTKKRDRKITIRGLYTCTAVIKQFLSVTWYTVMTPRGLYRRLIKEGYEEI